MNLSRQPNLGTRQDWHLMDGDKLVARVYQSAVDPSQWQFFLQVEPYQIGTADSLEAAVEAVKRAVISSRL